VGFPAVIKDGVALTATNISDKWLFCDVAAAMREAVDFEADVLNDADAAGLAEVRFGAGVGVQGKVLVVTLGTGVGTSLFSDGVLVPNIELGRVIVRGKPAWERVPNSVREKKNLDWDDWARDLETFLEEVDLIAWPELIVIGGGVSEDAHRFLAEVKCRPAVMPARMRNHAGIIGAAVFAADAERRRREEVAVAGGS
jgi:polyphosphate glucokinase